LKRISILTLISIFSMLTSMAVQVIIAIQLGAGAERDSLFVAMSVPLFLNLLLVSTVGVVITPAVLSHSLPEEQRRMVFRVLVCLALATSILAGFMYGVRASFVDLLAPGFNRGNRVLTAELLAVAVIMMPIQASSSVLGGYLVARERILVPNLALTAGNMVTLGCIVVIGRSLQALDVVLATLAGAVLVLLTLTAALFLQPAGAGPAREMSGIQGAGIARFYRQAMPLFLSGLISRSMPFVERNLASTMGVGTISCLGYAGYLVSFLVNATTAPTATVYYSRMCILWNEGKREQVGSILEKNLLMVMTVSLMGAGLFVIAGGEILQAFLLNTKFRTLDVMEFMTYSRILMVAYVFLTCGTLLSRLFYVVGSSKQMALLDCVGTGIYIFAAFQLARSFGGRGLAIAVSLHSIVVTALFVLWARRQFKDRLRRELLAAVTGMVAKWSLIFALALALKYLAGQGASGGSATVVGAVAYAGGAAWVIRSVWGQFGIRWNERGKAG
jgi:putative peptidoglycan lipid II flippase